MSNVAVFWTKIARHVCIIDETWNIVLPQGRRSKFLLLLMQLLLSPLLLLLVLPLGLDICFSDLVA